MYSHIQTVGWVLSQFEAAVEAHAERDASKRVGERHIAKVFAEVGPNEVGSIQLNARRLLESVTDAELGPPLSAAELDGWHGLLDANIIGRSHPVEQVDWTGTLNVSRATLWVSASLLRELDVLVNQRSEDAFRRHCRRFAAWLLPRVREVSRSGVDVRSDTTLRFWPRNSLGGMRDIDHLEAATELRERGVRICLVTNDLNLSAQASLAGLPTQRSLSAWHASEPKRED
jgi:hypothetical protein